MKKYKFLITGLLFIAIAIGGYFFPNVRTAFGARTSDFWKTVGIVITPNKSTRDVGIGGTTSGTADLFVDVSTSKIYMNGQLTITSTTTLSGVSYNWPDADGGAGELLTTDGNGQLSWSAAGAGDVTSVGDCTDGACLDGSSDGGTYVRLYDGDSNYVQLDVGNLGGDVTVNLPITAGTLINASTTQITASGNIWATFVGNLTGDMTGNADTATDLASNPTDCAANTYATTIAASGNLTCSIVDFSAGTNATGGRSVTLSADAIDADAETYTDTACMYLEDPTAADDLVSIWRAPLALTITEIWAESDQTVTFNLQEDDGSPANIMNYSLAPAAGEAATTTFADAAIAVESEIDLVTDSVSGTPTWVTICWKFTFND